MSKLYTVVIKDKKTGSYGYHDRIAENGNEIIGWAEGMVTQGLELKHIFEVGDDIYSNIKGFKKGVNK